MAEVETGTETWYPAEHAELVTTKGWGSPEDAVNSYVELEKSMGGRVKLPSDEDTPEANAERSAFYTKMGRPENAEGYKLPALPEGKEYDMELVGGMRTIAHEAGLTDGQFGKLVERYLKIETEKAEAAAAEMVRSKEEGDRILHETHGDKYEEFVEISKRAYTEYGDDELFELMEDPQFKPLLNKPAFIRLMNKVGVGNLDDNFVSSDSQTVEVDGNYVPQYTKSPEMYASGDDEESKKGRAWHRKNSGHDYGHDN